jgi:hypothetical protein
MPTRSYGIILYNNEGRKRMIHNERMNSQTYKCTEKCSLEQLAADIGYVYNDTEYMITRYRLAVIQQQILSGLYFLSPIEIKFIKKEDIIYITHFFPEIMLFEGSEDPHMVYAAIPVIEDIMVFMGLSRMLVRFFYSGFLEEEGIVEEEDYGLEDLVDSFYCRLQDIGKVDRLNRIDLRPSAVIIPCSRTLNILKAFVGDGPVYTLIKSFLEIPVMDKEGNDVRVCGIPFAGEISKIIFDIVMRAIFDYEFRKRFPGVSFHRFVYDVYIPTDGIIFDERDIYTFLEEIGLQGRIDSIGPGDDTPLKPIDTGVRTFLAYNNAILIYINNKGQVQVCNAIDY